MLPDVGKCPQVRAAGALGERMPKCAGQRAGLGQGPRDALAWHVWRTRPSRRQLPARPWEGDHWSVLLGAEWQQASPA